MKEDASCVAGTAHRTRWSATTFSGAFRGKSEKYGAVVWLCGDRCHRNGKSAVHRNGDQMRRLRRYGQLTIMKSEGWTEDDFRREFGKSYL